MPYTKIGDKRDYVCFDFAYVMIIYAKYILKDGEWVQTMAGAPKADDIPNGPPLAVFIDLPECLHPGNGRSLPSSQVSKEHRQLVDKIRNVLATNTAIVVNGWTPDLQTDFSVDGIDIY